MTISFIHPFRMKMAVCAMALQLVCGGSCFAQKVEKNSTVCNPDGTVTFLYKNDNARNVQVDVQFAGRHDMVKDEKTGLWMVTLGPAASDMYPYHFEVDGVSVMDPLCEQYFPNEGFKNSLLEIPGKGVALAHDIRNVPHGNVEYVHYYSKNLGATNSAIVYLPPSYTLNKDKKYPVFYLISGTTDTEEVYFKVGRMNYILDNLLAENAAKEMIIVLPYGNPYKLLPPQKTGQMPQMGFGNDVFSNDLVDDLMPYIESHYRTINDRDHRAIGGFSRGGNQGLSNGLRHLDKFSYLCSYSSFTSTDIPGVYDDPAINSKIHLFWLGIGTDDFLYGTGRDYMEFLDKKGIRTVKEFTTDKFGHTWMNAKFFLDKTLRLLFNPEASEKAMSKGIPTPAATGKEEAFTPAVMARLFPKPIISPEFEEGKVTFRLKAPEAKKVVVEREGLDRPIAMEKDADGVWSVTIDAKNAEVFKYCFVMDDTKVADPNNMYLSPDKGFKYSVCNNPYNRYSFTTMGAMEHGQVCYDLNANRATYIPPTKQSVKHVVKLIPGKDDTLESWFKVGGADAIADQLLASGQAVPCLLVAGDAENLSKYPASKQQVTTLKASDYPTWQARRDALENLLKKLK